jgi:hypothetical protein
MLTIFRRHKRSCEHRAEGPRAHPGKRLVQNGGRACPELSRGEPTRCGRLRQP